MERTTAMLTIRKLKKGKKAQNLANTVIDMLLPYKESIKSITSDNGTEFAEHQKTAKKLNTNFYFAQRTQKKQMVQDNFTKELS